MIYLDDDTVINPDRIESFRWENRQVIICFTVSQMTIDGVKAEKAWKILEEWVGDE